jgi:uncharacterized protein YaiL (DUF2058 family)
MSISLKDQLLALGFKKSDPPPKPDRPPQQHAKHGKPDGQRHDGQRRDGQSRDGQRRDGQRHDGQRRDNRPHGAPQQHHQNQRRDAKPRTQEEIDLAKAYAIRAQTEKAERARVEREAQERAREKKERKQKLATLLAEKSLNIADADVPRHFPHGDKIRRIYVTAEQLVRLNGGELGVVQHLGRYLLVEAAIAKATAEISPEALVLLPDPNAPADDDIPPDLVW